VADWVSLNFVENLDAKMQGSIWKIQTLNNIMYTLNSLHFCHM